MFKKIVGTEKEQFQKGYNYAVDELINRRLTPLGLDSYLCGVSLDPFDSGTEAAIQDITEKEQFQKGYNYAAGELVSGDHTPASLESYFEDDCIDDFDCGVADAIQDAIAQGIVEDDRI